MATYNAFVFEGHGLSEKTGAFDPGATNGSVTENSLVDAIVKEAKAYLDKTGLNIHYDENNYVDCDLAGNTYTSKCGISVHINSAIGASGVEAFVPLGEKFLDYDVEICTSIAKKLGIPNRGVKSRDYDTEKTVMRTNGIKLSGTDYYKEIRDAWSRGISLCILEVGFIQNDLSKIQANIKHLGYLVAKYIANACGKEITENVASTNTSKPSSALIRVYSDSKQVGAYSNLDNAIAEAKRCLSISSTRIVRLERI